MPRGRGHHRTVWLAGRSRALPQDVQGARRMQERCRTCVHFKAFPGPNFYGTPVEGEACMLYKRELCYPEAKRPCPKFRAAEPAPT